MGSTGADLQQLLRTLAPEVLQGLLRRHRDFASAEDAVQEALLAAATQWPEGGLPERPRAWLLHVATQRLTDQLRAEAARRQREVAVARQVHAPHFVGRAVDDVVPDEDEALELHFMCCHPALTSSSAIALTLRAIGGLTTAEIARAFLVPEATMAQRISRAKQQIREHATTLRRTSPAQRSERLRPVMQVLYLTFNEGYATSSGPALARPDLSNEAIRLTRRLARLVPDDPEVEGLLALMLLTDARRAARLGPAGELVPLDRQDRALWDQRAIAEGVSLLTRALARGSAGPYQVQAAIAAVHDEAPGTEATDWPQILGLYGLLLRMSDNPMARLSQAIALAMVEGPAAGLRQLEQLAADPRLSGHHRLEAARAHLLERAGDVAAAVDSYRRAAERTASTAERDYLLLQAAKLEGASGAPFEDEEARSTEGRPAAE